MREAYSHDVHITVTPEDWKLWKMLPGNRAQWFRGALRERMSQHKRLDIKVVSDLAGTRPAPAISPPLAEPQSAKRAEELIES